MGSAIVKVKHPSGNNTAVEIGAMVKRETGFDPNGGDWEYLFVDAVGKLKRGMIASCKDCHSGRASSDFLFLPYMDKRQASAAKTNTK